MSACRVLRGYRSSCLVLFVVGMIWGPCWVQGTEALPLDDPNVVLEKVISALKNRTMPVRGRGTAVMLTENYRPWLDNTELIVDFLFTERMSRTDIFEGRRGVTGSRLFAQAVSDEIDVGVYPFGVEAHRPRRHLDIGLDFQPEVFMHFKDIPLTSHLQCSLDHPEVDRSVKLDDEGILHFVTSGHVVNTIRGDEYDNEIQFRFDTRRDFLPVYSSFELRWADRDKWSRSEVKLEWAKHNSVWYPARAEYVLQPGNCNHRTVVVENFTPDVKDEQFMMDWLDVPDGAFLSDSRKDRWYKSPLRPVEDPEIPLDEIDFVKKVRKRQSSVASKADANEAGKAASVFYLRDYQTGRLIGPLSLKAGSLLPSLDKETYIVADPTAFELEIRQRLLDSYGHRSIHLDCELGEVIGWINRTLERGLGDRAPYVRIDGMKAFITIEITDKESAYDVLLRIASKVRARLFIEDGAVALSRKRLTELTRLDTTTSETAARRGLASR